MSKEQRQLHKSWQTSEPKPKQVPAFFTLRNRRNYSVRSGTRRSTVRWKTV